MTATVSVGLRCADVRVYADRCGREVVTIPDHVAVPLRAAVLDGWRSMGHGRGQSRLMARGSWAFGITDMLLIAYAGTLVPEGLVSSWEAETQRDGMVGAQRLSAAVVGDSGYNPLARWWSTVEPFDHLYLRIPAAPRRVDVDVDTIVWEAVR